MSIHDFDEQMSTPPQPDALREAITHILLDHSAIPLVAAADRILAAVAQERDEIADLKLSNEHSAEVIARWRELFGAKEGETAEQCREIWQHALYEQDDLRTKLAAVTRELEEELKGTREVLAQRDEQLAKTTLECVQLEEALKGQLTTKGVKEIPLPEAFLASVREAVNERLERLHGDEYSIQQDTDWSAIGQQFVGREPKL